MTEQARRGRSLWRIAEASCVLACLLGATAAARGEERARGAAAFDNGNPRVEAELLIDAQELRPGQTLRVGVLFELDRGWHIYWRNPGESGLPTELDWNFERARVGPIRWPVPEVFQESGGFLTTYGYSDAVLLASDVTIESRSLGSARVEVVADFVTCEVGCIPGRISLSRDIAVTAAGRPASPAVAAVFERYEAREARTPDALGLRVDAVYSQSAVRPGDDFRAAIRVSSCDGALAGSDCKPYTLATSDLEEAFIPDTSSAGIELTVVGYATEERQAFGLALLGRASADAPKPGVQRLRGLIPVSAERGQVTHIEVDLPLPRAAVGAAVTAVESPWLGPSGGFGPPGIASNANRPQGLAAVAAIFGLALLGGLILNLMPCVLPILAVKVFHIAELAHADRRHVLGHGAAYTAGVVGSMVALAAVVAGLRAAGTAVGWGFQFQEPVFVAAICTVLTLFALNLFGVFEIAVQPAGAPGAHATGLRRSFFEGLLAVVLATPCTAPFLGTAVGFAFASPAPVIFAIFIAIGLGLALPFALVTLIPAWAKIIPRPGPWMISVRKALGFSLIATTVWLLWVVGRTVGVDGQALLMGYLVVVAFLTWVYGGTQRSERPWLSRAAGAALAVGGVAGLAMLPLGVSSLAPAESETAQAGGSEVAGGQAASTAAWRAYDPGEIEQELARGRPVFVDFTADWCLTCKVNESVVLRDQRVKSAFAQLGVATFKADWTLYDDEIRSVLADFGRAGVPMYLVYGPEAPGDPELLPELLTVDLVIEALENALPASGV